MTNAFCGDSWLHAANCADDFEMVSVDGASMLAIKFDEQCRTEDGCDYLSFYRDESKNDKCADDRR